MTIVVPIAFPQFWNTFPIGAFELGLGITFAIMANALVLVASVRAIVVRVAHPRTGYTATC